MLKFLLQVRAHAHTHCGKQDNDNKNRGKQSIMADCSVGFLSDFCRFTAGLYITLECSQRTRTWRYVICAVFSCVFRDHERSRTATISGYHQGRQPTCCGHRCALNWRNGRSNASATYSRGTWTRAPGADERRSRRSTRFRHCSNSCGVARHP